MVAPVVIFAFNRPDLLLQTLTALEASSALGRRHVFIYCDGPRHSEEAKLTERVAAIARTWLKKNRGSLFSCDLNRGLRQSITSGVSEIAAEYRSCIVLEDDIITAQAFLPYMDSMLELYENCPQVWQVSGWFAPGAKGKPAHGCLRVPGCWGWGTWHRAWDKYNDDANELSTRICEVDRMRFNIDDSYDYWSALKRNASGTLNTWQVRWYASMFLEGALAVYPGKSLTRNIGFDERGSNCRLGPVEKRLIKQDIRWKGPDSYSRLPAISECPSMLKQLRDFFLWQGKVWSTPRLTERLRTKIRRIMRREQ